MFVALPPHLHTFRTVPLKSEATYLFVIENAAAACKTSWRALPFPIPYNQQTTPLTLGSSCLSYVAATSLIGLVLWRSGGPGKNSWGRLETAPAQAEGSSAHGSSTLHAFPFCVTCMLHPNVCLFFPLGGKTGGSFHTFKHCLQKACGWWKGVIWILEVCLPDPTPACMPAMPVSAISHTGKKKEEKSLQTLQRLPTTIPAPPFSLGEEENTWRSLHALLKAPESKKTGHHLQEDLRHYSSGRLGGWPRAYAAAGMAPKTLSSSHESVAYLDLPFHSVVSRPHTATPLPWIWVSNGMAWHVAWLVPKIKSEARLLGFGEWWADRGQAGSGWKWRWWEGEWHAMYVCM